MKIAMAQMLVEGGKLAENLKRATEAIAAAKTQGAQIIVLPECLDLGWTHPSVQNLAQPIPGSTSEILAQAAKKAGIMVVAGITEKEDARLYNSAVIISADGKILRHHRKVNELDIAQHIYSLGNSVETVDTSLGRVGLAICADMSQPDGGLGQALGYTRAEIILSPAAWAVPPDHDNQKEPYGALWKKSYSSLAEKFGIPVIGVSNVGKIEGGPWNGWNCIGCSLAVGADGQILAQGPYGVAAEALLFVDVDLKKRGKMNF
jgi:predicted amidohydrolase